MVPERRNNEEPHSACRRLLPAFRKYGESASITNQRTIVREYCEKHGIILVEEFADDGYSGGNFERPGFRAMLEHLKTGKVNTVITKDLSRLGRDMTESSHYAIFLNTASAIWHPAVTSIPRMIT